MEVKRNLQIQNDAANQRASAVPSGTKNTNGSINPSPKNTSGRAVASKPQSEKPVGNLKSSNQSPMATTTIPNATGMKIATPKGSGKAVGVQKTQNSPSMAAVETPTEALGLRNRKRNSQNDLSDDGSNKKTRKNPTVSEPVTPLGATPVQKRVNNLNKSTVLTPSTGSNVSIYILNLCISMYNI